MKENKCWLCLRVTPKEIAKAVHKLFPKEITHKILEDSITYVERAYAKNPIFFCGKSTYRIIGGLLYLLALKYNYHVTQETIAEKLSYLRQNIPRKRRDGSVWGVSTTIRAGYQDWQKLFPKELNIEKLCDAHMDLRELIELR